VTSRTRYGERGRAQYGEQGHTEYTPEERHIHVSKAVCALSLKGQFIIINKTSLNLMKAVVGSFVCLVINIPVLISPRTTL
jgi:hypothetical protein